VNQRTLDVSIGLTLKRISEIDVTADLEWFRRLLYKYWCKGIPVGRMEMLYVVECKRDGKSFESACRRLV
jgi:hypothetical protein